MVMCDTTQFNESILINQNLADRLVLEFDSLIHFSLIHMDQIRTLYYIYT